MGISRKLILVSLMVLLLACGGGGGGTSTSSPQPPPQPPAPTLGSIVYTGSLNTGREYHTATLLPNGKVLITGGMSATNSTSVLATTELYDPTTGTFNYSGPMLYARTSHTATLLSNGNVLLAGGGSNVAEIYNSATGICASTGTMIATRFNHTATLLPTNKVLVSGKSSQQGSGNSLATAEIYDPTTGTFSITGAMGTPRSVHSATLLPNGKVMLAGGVIKLDMTYVGNYLPANSAELYDYTIGTFTATGSMNERQYNQTATLLQNGKVLIAGGTTSDDPSDIGTDVELYDPASGSFSVTGSVKTARWGPTANVLPDGKIILFGGYSTQDTSLSSSEVYDPSRGVFVFNTSLLTGRDSHTATTLVNGKILIVGGWQSGNGSNAPLASAELFTY